LTRLRKIEVTLKSSCLIRNSHKIPRAKGTMSSSNPNSTKRKFNALLNSIGSSASSLDSDRAKQRRLSNDASTLRTPSAPTLDSSEKLSSLKRTIMEFSRPAGSARVRKPLATAEDPGPKPTYIPTDREEFLKRLSSYRNISDWRTKPDRIDEVAWAKKGWVCQGHERVRCVTCNIEIMVKLTREDREGSPASVMGEEKDIRMYSYYFNIYVSTTANLRIQAQALVDKYAELLSTAHDASCPWRHRGCDDSILKQPIYNIPKTFESLRRRYDSFLAMADKLPEHRVFELPEHYDLEALVEHIPESIIPKSSPNTVPTPAGDAAKENSTTIPAPSYSVNLSALTLSLFGFTTRPTHAPKLGAAECPICFRTIGLWMYKPQTKRQPDGTEITKPATKSTLDPRENHRQYCPWVNAATQNPDARSMEAKPIWGILKELLERESRVAQVAEARERKGGAERPTTATEMPEASPAPANLANDAEYEKRRDEEDKIRWSRLRKVKSLFESKSKKIHRAKPH
jgi:hypothetical protein